MQRRRRLVVVTEEPRGLPDTCRRLGEQIKMSERLMGLGPLQRKRFTNLVELGSRRAEGAARHGRLTLRMVVELRQAGVIVVRTGADVVAARGHAIDWASAARIARGRVQRFQKTFSTWLTMPN